MRCRVLAVVVLVSSSVVACGATSPPPSPPAPPAPADVLDISEATVTFPPVGGKGAVTLTDGVSTRTVPSKLAARPCGGAEQREACGFPAHEVDAKNPLL